jgi:predicted kinase
MAHVSDAAPTVPARSSAATVLTVLIGAPGSGKSTLAAALATRPTEVVSSDAVRSMLCDDPADQGATAAAFALVHRIVAERLTRGRPTIVDATNVEAADRAPYLALAARHADRDRPVVVRAVVVDPPLAVCLARNAARAERRVPDAVVARYHDRVPRDPMALLAEGFAQVEIRTS